MLLKQSWHTTNVNVVSWRINDIEEIINIIEKNQPKLYFQGRDDAEKIFYAINQATGNVSKRVIKIQDIEALSKSNSNNIRVFMNMLQQTKAVQQLDDFKHVKRIQEASQSLENSEAIAMTAP